MRRHETIRVVSEALRGEHLRAAKTKHKAKPLAKRLTKDKALLKDMDTQKQIYREQALTAKQDWLLRVHCYHLLAEHYRGRLPGADYGRFVKAIREILFTDEERARQSPETLKQRPEKRPGDWI